MDYFGATKPEQLLSGTIVPGGSGWNCSWLSYVESQTPTLSADVQMPRGGYLHFDFVNGWATNYYNNFRLHVITDGSGNVTSYELLKPDGSKIVYAFFRTSPMFRISPPISNTATAFPRA